MKRWFFDRLAPELDRAIADALRVYRDLGVEIVEIDLGDVELSQEMFGFRIIMADGYHVQNHAFQTATAHHLRKPILPT